MKNNRGFSLIELLVAIAISGVVILMISFIMVQGTTLFKGESEVIDIQGELQIVRNQISEALMGAKSVVVVDAGDDIIIYTGAVDPETNMLVAENNGDGGTSTVTTERIITYDSSEKSLYISSTKAAATKQGSLISKFVDSVEIEFNEDCADKNTSGLITEYNNPFSVDIKIKLKNGGHESDVSMTVRVRNILSEVAWYNTDSTDTILKNIVDKAIYKVR